MTSPSMVLITGPEELLVERAIAAVVARAREDDAEVIRLDAAAYEPGALLVHANPSLFGGAKCLVVRGLHEAPDELQADLLTFLADDPDDVSLVVTHAAGMKGKKVLD